MSELADIARLDAEIDLLAAVDQTDAPFVSCYLDVSRGKSTAIAFLKKQASTIRWGLDGAARFDFDNAVGMIREELDREWHPQVRGLALFARGLAGDRFLSALRFAAPVASSLALYPVPDIVPLLALRQQESRFALLVAEEPTAAGVRRWDARIELTRLARQEGIPILAGHSDELRCLDGVGCTVRHLSEPSAARFVARSIPLVA